MARAIRLARAGLYTTHPNPRVGCVLVGPEGVIGDRGQRGFQRPLYAAAVVLDLPAAETGPVIFDAERDANSSACDCLARQ